MHQCNSIILYCGKIQWFDVSARWCSAPKKSTTQNDVIHFAEVGNVRAVFCHVLLGPLLSYVSVQCLS